MSKFQPSAILSKYEVSVRRCKGRLNKVLIWVALEFGQTFVHNSHPYK